jgi:hypothetical protein
MQGRQRGFVEISGPNGVEEYETFTCGHGGEIVKVPHKAPPEQLGGICKVCMSMVCAKCLETGKCDPLEEKMKRIEDRARFFRQVGV